MVMARLSADYTLTNNTSLQRFFNNSASGAVAMEAGLWVFEWNFYLTTMSATSGNARFQLSAGTATLAAVSMHAVGIDNNSPLNSGTQTGSFAANLLTNASAVSAGTGTGMAGRLEGMFRVTATGTVLPQIQLVTGNAAVAKAGSFFRATRIGADTDTTIGTWS
jgi:hypothetical protein